MGAVYFYFCSQLPSLRPGDAPPMTLARFDALLDLLPEADAGYIRQCDFPPSREARLPEGSAGARFRAFEYALRGEIAGRRSADRTALPPETGTFGGLAEAVNAAAGAGDQLERERRLDVIRWRMLDDMAAAEPFSREAAACYRLQLALLVRVDRLREAAGRSGFRAAIDAVDSRSLE